MSNAKISALTSATTPLAGTEVVPLVQSSTTKKATVENLFTATQPSGNANGIVYLNGSKQATTSASFFYNGTNLGINTSSVTAIFGKTVQLGDGTGNNTISMVASGGSGFLANVGSVFALIGRGGTTLNLGTNDVDRISIDLSGNTTLLTGNLVQGTAAKGINFTANTPAAGMTSQLLNWYEEGDWTPAINVASGSITLNTTYTKGKYVRVGRLVTLTAYVYVTSVLTPSGAVYLSGVPFATASGYGFRAASGIYADGLETTATTQINAYMIDSSGFIYIEKYAAGVSSAIGADIKTNSSFILSLSYMTS